MDQHSALYFTVYAYRLNLYNPNEWKTTKKKKKHIKAHIQSTEWERRYLLFSHSTEWMNEGKLFVDAEKWMDDTAVSSVELA